LGECGIHSYQFNNIQSTSLEVPAALGSLIFPLPATVRGQRIYQRKGRGQFRVDIQQFFTKSHSIGLKFTGMSNFTMAQVL
jgi:hypothetical protein